MGRKNGKFSNIQSDTVITGQLQSHRTTEQRNHGSPEDPQRENRKTGRRTPRGNGKRKTGRRIPSNNGKRIWGRQARNQARNQARIMHGNKHGNKHEIKHRIKHGIKHGIKTESSIWTSEHQWQNLENGRRIWSSLHHPRQTTSTRRQKLSLSPHNFV